MKFKGLLKTLLVCVLVLSMLLSVACSKSETTDTDEENKCKHSETVLENAKVATCVEEGYSGDKICKDCGKTLEQGQTIAVTDHEWDEGAVTKAPTCASTGVKTTTCKICKIEETEVLELLPCDNEYLFEANEAHSLVCSVCYKATTGTAHTKSETVAKVEAGCLEGGYTLYHCDDCGYDFKEYDDTKPALGHAWDKDNPIIVAPTCSTEGTQHFVCANENCDAQTQPFLLGTASGVHNYILENSEYATCISTGYEEYVCSGCGAVKTKVLNKIPHSYENSVVDGNWIYKECSCGQKISTYDATSGNNASVDASGINSGEAFEMNFANSTIEFPSSVVGQLSVNSEISVNAEYIDSDTKNTILSSSAMSDEDKNALSADNSRIYDFGVMTGTDSIHTFSENVTITLPYTLGEEEDEEGIVIWYVSANGELDAIDNVFFYDPDGDRVGSVIFEVEHFSFYAIAYKETPEMKCRRGVHDYSNEELWEKVDATCQFYGYTVKECGVCGTASFDNFIDMKDHTFGDIITPKADCESGSYKHQICSSCNSVRNYDYIPATGHTVKTLADCENSAVCETCHKIVASAYGHKWSEWTVISEATEGTPGLKRRNCSICGKVDEVNIYFAADIEEWNFGSYQGFIETIISEVANFGDGKAKVVFDQYGTKYDIEVTVNQENDIYTAYIKSVVTVEEEPVTYDIYYKDGNIIYLSENETSIGNVNNFNNILPDFSSFYAYIRSIVQYYDHDIGSGFEMIGKLLDEYVEVFGAGVNEKLSANGKDYTVEELRDAYKSLNALYVYFTYKLGVESSSGMPEDVAVPTVNDLHNVLGIFMTQSKVNGNTVYTYDFSQMKQNYLDIIEAVEKEGEKTLDKIIYDNFGDVITAHYPELTDWSKLIDHLRSELGGSVKVKTLVDKIISVAENSEACTQEQLYDIIEKALALVLYQKYDIESIVNEYSDKTLDDLVQMILGETDPSGKATGMTWFYDNLNQTFTTTVLNDCVVESYYSDGYYDPDLGYVEGSVIEVTFGEKLEDVKNSINMLDYSGDFKITFDADNNFVDLKYSQTVNIEEFDEGGYSYLIEIAPTDEKVIIPDSAKDYADTKIEYNYDDAGNLVITGIPEDFATSFELIGRATVALSENVTNDETLSEKFGINVYMLNEKYWTDTDIVGSVIKDPEGNYYEYDVVYLNNVYPGSYHRNIFSGKVAYADFEKDPEAYVPADDASPIAYFNNEIGEKVYVYTSDIGYFYMENDEWMIITDYDISYYKDEEESLFYMYSVNGESYAAICENLVISNIAKGYIFYDENHDRYEGGYLYIETGLFNNLKLNVIFIDGEIYVVNFIIEEEKEQEIIQEYHLTNLVTEFPEGVYASSYYYDDEITVIFNGEELEGCYLIELLKKCPTYYAEYDGYYFQMSEYNAPFVKVGVDGFETYTLPDGRVLYVVGRTGDIEAIGTIFGYISVGNGYYAQAACMYEAGELTEIKYRADAYTSYDTAVKEMNCEMSEILSIRDYLICNDDGSYTISKEAIDFINENHIKGDRFGMPIFYYVYSGSIVLNNVATNKDGTVSVGSSYAIYSNLGEEFEPSFGGGSNEIYWDDWFADVNEDDDYNDYDFSVDKNDDGSVEIILGEGNVPYVDFYFDMSQVLADEVVIKDDDLSAKYGFDIYTSKINSRSNSSYAVYGGKYYSIQYVYDVINYEVKEPVQILRDTSTLRDIDYQYDEINESGELCGRIYRTTLSFYSGNNMYYGGTDIFVKIIDGKIMVLTGVSNESDIGLKYEGYIDYESFINGLTLESQDYEHVTNTYLEDEYLTSTSFHIMNGEEYIYSVSYYYYEENGKKNYVQINDYETVDIPYLDGETSLPNGYLVYKSQDKEFDGMKYQVISGFYYYLNVEEYVKIGDKFVEFYNIYDADFREVLENIADQQYIYGVYDGSEWTYYSNYEWDYNNDLMVPSGDPIVITDTDYLFQDDYIGETENGTAYTFDYYSADSIDIHTLSNGVDVYCRKGSTNDCYAKMAENMFVRGYLMEVDGGFEFIPEYGYAEEFDSNELTGALNLYEYITVDGSTITFDKDIIDVLEKYNEHLVIGVYGYTSDGYYDHYGEIAYSKLASYFN